MGERYTPGEAARYTSNVLFGYGKMSSSASETQTSRVVSPGKKSTVTLMST